MYQVASVNRVLFPVLVPVLGLTVEILHAAEGLPSDPADPDTNAYDEPHCFLL